MAYGRPLIFCNYLRSFLVLECKCEVASATVLSVRVERHENSCSAICVGAFTSQALDLAITVDLVIFKDSKLDFLVLVLDLFWCSVCLLLSLLCTTTQAEDEMQRGFLLDVVICECTTVLELLSSKDETLLIRRNAFLVLDL